jgi:hypothetical protein
MCMMTLKSTNSVDSPRRGRPVALDCLRGFRAARSGTLSHWLVLLTMVVGWPAIASAQNAQLSGVVRDVQGTVIVGAEARLFDEATGGVLTTRSNERGVYVFASVRPTTYRLELTAQGFADAVHREVTLHVDERVVFDVSMVVAGHQEATEVVGKSYLLATADGSLGTVIDRTLAAELPLRGRSFTALVTLAPGVSLIPGRLGSGDASEFHVNGQRNDANYLMVDGVNGPTEMDAGGFQSSSGQRLSSTVTGTVNGGLSIDAVQEVRIQTSSFAAEFGRTPGGQISLITRSGTNRFDGSIFEQFRNDDLMANDWFANAKGVAKPTIEEHQFGATLGGPLVRDRLFFFASYEGLRLDQPLFQTKNVPSVEARNQASPVKNVLNSYPMPTGPTRPDLTAELAAYYGTRRSSDTWGVRLDQSIRQGMQVFGRYARVPSMALDDSPFVFIGAAHKRAQTVTGGLTATLWASTLLDVRAGYGDSSYRYDGGTPGPQEAVRQWLPDATPASGGLEFGTTNLSALVTGTRPGNLQQQANLVASLSHVRGAHTLKVGMDYRRLQPEAFADYTLTARFASLAQALAGTTLATLNVSHVFPLEGTFNNYSFYVQDDWKVRPQLSMTYGLRWDINPAPSFPTGQGPYTVTTFEPASQVILSSQRNVPLWKTEYGNVFPRLGLSYSLDQAGRTVVGGGVGLFGDLTGSVAAIAALTAPGTRTSLSRTNVALPLSDNDVRGLEQPSVSLPYEGSANVVDPRLHTPRTAQWNVNVQRAITSRQSISASYVGASGETLLQRTTYRRGVNSNFLNEFHRLTAAGESRYQALQLQYRGRLMRGMQSLVSYTFGSARDTSSAYLSTEHEWAPSNYDLRHSLNAALSWELPNGTSRAAWALKDWGVHVSGGARSGYPFTMLSTTAFLQGQETSIFQRASTAPGVPIIVEDAAAPGGRRFNSSAFVNPPPTEQGNTSRNEFRGFSAYQMDLALQRSLRFGEVTRVRVRIEAFNLFNTPVFLTPVNAVGVSQFGQPTSTVNSVTGGLYRSGGPRSVAVSIRMDY